MLWKHRFGIRPLRDLCEDLKWGGYCGGTKLSPYAQRGAHATQSISYAQLSYLFAKNDIPIYDADVLVDVGCGKGRVINYWLGRELRNPMIGIELDEAVAGPTRERLNPHANVEILAGDATEVLPDDGTLFFVYNPFGPAVMERFKARLARLCESGREVRMIYYYPLYLDVFRDDPRWTVEPLRTGDPQAAVLIRPKAPASEGGRRGRAPRPRDRTVIAEARGPHGMASLVQRGLRKVRRITLRRTAALRSPLRAGIIGFGGIGPDHLEAYEDSGLALPVAVSDLLPRNLAHALDRSPAMRAYVDFRRMLEEVRPDVVSICTWPQAHAEAVEAAAAAGVRGIVCEKPLALTLDDLERMRAACRPRGVKLAGGHQYRFHPAFLGAAEVIRSGRLGRLVRVRGAIKSTLANNGPHLIDTVRFLLGDPPAEQVSCQCWRDRGEFNRGIPAEDGASGVILFRGGIPFEFATGDRSPGFFEIRVEGSEGVLEVTPQRLEVGGRASEFPASAITRCRSQQFREFLRWVNGQSTTYSADFKQGAQAAELVLACYESARLGGPVALPLQNRGDVIAQLYPEADPAPPAEADPPPSSAIGERLALAGGPRTVKTWYGGKPDIGRAELVNLARVITSKNLSCTNGQMVPALEGAFARFYGCPRAVASTSGTAAIHVALAALGLNPGDEVITTPMTDMGTIIPILACNCLPVFADVDPVTGNLTAESIAQRITPRTRAVILVHLFGRPADLAGIGDLLRSRGIPLIEDCAQAHAAEYRGRKVGTFGDFGCFSFQQSKQITCGDGGITLVNRADLAERAALFVDKGWDRRRGVRAHLFLGMNYRMTELQGAVALAQLRKLPRLIQARRAAAEHLTRRLGEIAGALAPPEEPGVNPSWWMYAFRVDEERLGTTTDRVADALLVEGVRANRRYLPEPIFEYDVLKYQRTYGDSRYPFSSFPYEPPRVGDFPGLREFNDRLIFLNWNHHARPRHAAAIAAAVRKVVSALERAERSSRSRLPQSAL